MVKIIRTPRFLTLLLVISALSLPFWTFAEETASTTPEEPSTPPQTTISATVNVRYEGSLVWSGPVTLTQSSTVSLTDNTGTSRSLPSDSALSALSAADSSSNDFSLSNIAYYSDFGAFYIKCLSIVPASTEACDNWQYVVNSTYPPLGSDKYTVKEGDVIYFYFGNPRRVSLEQSTITASSSVQVLVETYDYTNNTWKPLGGATVGATVPNPDDPYSPLVKATDTSASDGKAEIFISLPGTYGVGLAEDYYSSTENLIVVTEGPTQSPTGTSGTDIYNPKPLVKIPVKAATLLSMNPPKESPEDKEKVINDAKNEEADKIIIVLDISLDQFVKNYKEITAKQAYNS